MNHEKAICIKKNKWSKRKLFQNPFLVPDKRNWSKDVYSSDRVGMSGQSRPDTKLTNLRLLTKIWQCRWRKSYAKTENSFHIKTIKIYKNINPVELLLNMISMILKISYNNQNHSSLQFLKNVISSSGPRNH